MSVISPLSPSLAQPPSPIGLSTLPNGAAAANGDPAVDQRRSSSPEPRSSRQNVEFPFRESVGPLQSRLSNQAKSAKNPDSRSRTSITEKFSSRFGGFATLVAVFLAAVAGIAACFGVAKMSDKSAAKHAAPVHAFAR